MTKRKEDKLPWDKWFWDDYEGDHGLRACSLAAQGLWWRMLSLMARATPKGELRIEGEPCTERDLARLVGEDKETVADLMSELHRRGVYSVTRTGVIYNRRMRKAALISRKRSESGKLGAAVTNGKHSGNEDLPRQKSGKHLGKSTAPEARSQKPDKEKNIKKRKSGSGSSPPRKTSLPEGFPDRDNQEKAIRYWRGKGRTDLLQQLPDIILGFQAHHREKATRSASWASSWQTWYVNAVKFNRPANTGQAQSGSYRPGQYRLIN